MASNRDSKIKSIERLLQAFSESELQWLEQTLLILDTPANRPRKQSIQQITSLIPALTDSKIEWLESVLKEFNVTRTYKLSPESFFDSDMLERFGDALLIHHSFSHEPFTKDRFEYVLEKVCKKAGKSARLAPKGNPGYDISIDQEHFSLKTQADSSIKKDFIHISKFMELGKGRWGNQVEDLYGLRDQFLAHMDSYDRILILRNLRRHPQLGFYELVEVPKTLLEEAKEGRFEMMHKSTQNPKPGYCRVFDQSNELKFELYFDGGGERKLQIKQLRKDLCFVHATWDLAGGTLPL